MPLGAGASLVAFDVLSLDNSSPLLLMGGVVSIGYGAYEAVTGFWRDYRRLCRLYPRERDEVTRSFQEYEPPYDSWDVVSSPRGVRRLHHPL